MTTVTVTAAARDTTPLCVGMAHYLSWLARIGGMPAGDSVPCQDSSDTKYAVTAENSRRSGHRSAMGRTL